MTRQTAGVCRRWLWSSFYGFHEGQQRKNNFDDVIMGGSGLARAIERPHQQCEIAGGGLDEQFLVDVLDAPDIEPVHAASIELVCEVAFDLLPTLPL